MTLSICWNSFVKLFLVVGPRAHSFVDIIPSDFIVYRTVIVSCLMQKDSTWQSIWVIERKQCKYRLLPLFKVKHREALSKSRDCASTSWEIANDAFQRFYGYPWINCLEKSKISFCYFATLYFTLNIFYQRL